MDAEFGGPNQEYRYALWRVWDDSLPFVQFIGLNPSTADASKDDPTIRKCRGFAQRWGYGGICMTNLFAWRDTKPANMKKAESPIGEDNNRWLKEVYSEASLTIAAWGNDGSFLNRHLEVEKMLSPLTVLKLNVKTGQPGHPLYIPYETKPFQWILDGPTKT